MVNARVGILPQPTKHAQPTSPKQGITMEVRYTQLSPLSTTKKQNSARRIEGRRASLERHAIFSWRNFLRAVIRVVVLSLFSLVYFQCMASISYC